jgi:hypothetical protein
MTDAIRANIPHANEREIHEGAADHLLKKPGLRRASRGLQMSERGGANG